MTDNNIAGNGKDIVMSCLCALLCFAKSLGVAREELPIGVVLLLDLEEATSVGFEI
jgi:hypothetical protein